MENMKTSFFESESWLNILEVGLSARHLTTRDSNGHELSWAVFTRWPVKAAYVKFPLGLEGTDVCFKSSLEQHLLQLKDHNISFANISTPENLPLKLGFSWLHTASLPETVIDDLQNWSITRIAPTSRREVNKCLKNDVSVHIAKETDGEIIYEMYNESISRHSGKMKYSKKYFMELCKLGSSAIEFSLGIVRTKYSDNAGFIVIGHGDGTSYYLHGGMLERFRSISPGHISLVWGIEQARLRGNRQFNMLTSPSAQQGLVQFKERMGGNTYLRHHYRVPLNLSGRLAILTIHWMGKTASSSRSNKNHT